MNFKKLFMFTCILCSLLFVQGTALAATVHGNVYEWYSFEPLNNAVIEVNSTPEQYFVAVDAVYSFNLPPGNYLVKASYFEGNTIVYAAEETFKITENGDYVVDLLLFPVYEEELLDQSEFEEFDKDFEEAELVSEESSRNSTYALILLALCALLLAGYFWKRRPGKPSEMSNNLQKYPGGRSGAEPEVSGNEHESRVKSENFENSGESGGTFEEVPEMGSESPALKVVEEEVQRPEISVQGSGVEYLKEDMSEYEVLKVDEVPVTNELEENVPENEVLKEDKLPVTEELEEKGSEVKNTIGNTPEDRAREVLEESGVAMLPSRSQEPAEPEAAVQEHPEAQLPDDLKEILELIRANGNRITQRELRKKSRYSESKVSLMLSDLEVRGLIEKFKKGRGNIIRIPDEYVLKQEGDEN